jgi:hypothetical protein
MCVRFFSLWFWGVILAIKFEATLTDSRMICGDVSAAWWKLLLLLAWPCLGLLLVKLILTPFSMLRKTSSTANRQRPCLFPTNTEKYEAGFVSWYSAHVRLWNGRPRNRGFFSGGGRRFQFSAVPKSALGSSTLPKAPAALSLGLKRSGREAGHSPQLVPRLIMHGAIPPLSHGAVLGQLCLYLLHSLIGNLLRVRIFICSYSHELQTSYNVNVFTSHTALAI